MVYQNRGETITLDTIKYDDEKVFSLISSGDTDGVFQLESAGMRNLMQKLKPTSLNDIMVGISLFRPGPMDSIPRLFKGQKESGENKIRPSHARKNIEGYLWLYRVSGAGNGDRPRIWRGIRLGEAIWCAGRCPRKRRMLWRWSATYSSTAAGKSPARVKRGVPERVASKIFDNMMDFAQYAFNKSHACAYAVIGYYTAYLKCYYKLEFITALLNSFAHNPDKIASYIQYCKKTGVTIKPPDINKSFVKFTVERGCDTVWAGVHTGGWGKSGAGSRGHTGKKRRIYIVLFFCTDGGAWTRLNKKSLEGLITSGVF